VVIARLLSSFRFRLTSPRQSVSAEPRVTLRPKDGLTLAIEALR
jgi:hypothetical protein